MAALSFETYCTLKMTPVECTQVRIHQAAGEVQRQPGAERGTKSPPVVSTAKVFAKFDA